MRLWQEWLADRALRARADRYARTLAAEPAEDDARWLADVATHGDVDHARWELRYARRSLGLLSAERDALDDRTPSAVARAVLEALRGVPGIAAE